MQYPILRSRMMESAEIEALLAPLTEEGPCGPDLEYDADFGEMERACQGKPEQQYGDTIVAAEEPEWKDVKKRAEALMQRTRDMRVAVVWARASLHEVGITGFENAIRVLRGLVENFWETVHPELDADDNDDPTYRNNTLVTLCDDETLLKELREAPLVSSRAMGRFSLRDWEMAHEAGDQPAESRESESSGAWAEDDAPQTESAPSGPTVAAIEAAFTDADLDAIQATEEATRLAAEHIQAIDQFVTEKVGASMAVSLAPTRNMLREMNELVVSQLARRGVSTGDAAVADDVPAEDGDASSSAESTTATTASSQGNGFAPGTKIKSRAQAIAALEQVCDYYEVNEPSSPLPILLLRAQRLATKSFMDILVDLAPGAVSHAEALGKGAGIVQDYANSVAGSADAEESSGEEEEDSSSW
ncbi:MAG: type VI secretion system protein TssA [Planctomycetota bacterium]